MIRGVKVTINNLDYIFDGYQKAEAFILTQMQYWCNFKEVPNLTIKISDIELEGETIAVAVAEDIDVKALLGG